MNLILLHDDDLAPDGTARLRGRRAEHIREVHRASVGDTLTVGWLGGPVGRAVLLALSRDEAVLAPRWTELPPPPLPIELLVALPRPQIVKRVLQQAAQLGIKRIVLLHSARVEKSFWSAKQMSPAELEDELFLGLEQGKDTILPEVVLRRRFRPFVEDELDQFWPAPRARLLAHPGEPGWEAISAPTAASAVLAIGPEGGWVPFEVEQLRAKGFVPVSAGPRILRVDVAVPFLVGQLSRGMVAG